jgi:NADH:ubiquinone oxidoreductase subunit B-like Fe-S oxidoreductase
MKKEILDQLLSIPKRNDSVENQLTDLIMIANKLGMHKAADAINYVYKNLPEPKYACFVEAFLDNGVWYEVDPTCVIDSNKIHDCIFANEKMRKEQCEYWKSTQFKKINNF